jgi:hypothetical protein
LGWGKANLDFLSENFGGKQESIAGPMGPRWPKGVGAGEEECAPSNVKRGIDNNIISVPKKPSKQYVHV